jgi:hypothetical protein
MTLQHLQATKDVEEKLLFATKAFTEKNKILEMLCKTRTGEAREANELRFLEVSEAESQVIEQQTVTKVAANVTYDLFCQFVCGKAQTEWDYIFKNMNGKDPWTGINGAKVEGLRSWNWLSFKDCLELHKLAVFICDAAEKQASYIMSSLKKPIKMTIHQHTMCMEVLNGYLTSLPTLKDSVMVVASTEKVNKPFNKAMLVEMIMATSCCPTAWRTSTI